MADQSQFSYPSNLVVQREPVARNDEPTGEPESLAGRIDPRQMGSLGGREKPSAKERKRPHETIFDPKKSARLPTQGGNVITTDIDENLLYRPKTKENRVVYEKILSMIHNQMQEQSQEVIKSVVDEILAVLKNENNKDSDRKAEVEGFVGRISSEFFSDLLLNSKLITDYNPQAADAEKFEEEVRMPVVFDEPQKEASSEEEYVVEEGDDDSAEEERQAIKVKEAEMEVEREDAATHVNATDIDAYWLHAAINQVYNDPIRTQNVLGDVMNILNVTSNIECENELVKLFGHDHFTLVRLLHNNRHKIYYCTRLKQAQEDKQREFILAEMQESESGQLVLEQLQRNVVKLKKNVIEEEQKEDDLEKRLVEAINISDQGFQSISKKILDLESLAFTSQSHLMSNDKCHLPPGSYKISKKGYEEITIPASKHKSSKDKPVLIGELPSWAQPAFSGFKELNVIQSAVCDAAMNTSDNLLICAPTGAGKTNVALLTMLQVIGQHIGAEGEVDTSKFKMVYIAPMKALVNEQVQNFQKRLDPYKMIVSELTGDSHLTKQQIQQTQVLVVTPEKWDILTRKSANQFISLVRLIIIDEIHLLHDSRGPVLEAIVARTLRSFTEQTTRIVGLSATLPNYADVAAFIRVKPSGVFYFDNSYRPVPLQQQYIGVTEKKPIRRFLLMNEILYEKVSDRAGKAQVLIFVHSRKETVKTAKYLKETAFAKDELGKFLKEESISKKVIEEVLGKDEIRSPDLRELLQHGFAVHHAGLSRSDRDLVEQLFADKHVQVLVSTSTLAWGVNLPAHTVIIKGTQIYSAEQGRWVELSPQDILQMMGRAGRPRYDTKGEGIILTTYQELKFYLSLLNMQLPIESQFVSQLADQLNAEVALGSVQSLKQAANWLGYTYLYVRMLRNPSLYQIDEAEVASDPLLVRRRADLAHTAATILDKHGLVRYDRKSGLLESTMLGRIASYYYLRYPSVAMYIQHLKPNMGMIELFKIFSLSNEFKFIPIREEEKLELQRLTMSVPVPIKGSPEDPTTKVNVLLQAYISRLKLEGFALNSDMVFVTQSAARIMRALYEICLKHEWAQTALTALNLAKMVEQRMWSCMTPLRQFKGLPEEILKRIEKKEGITWEMLYNMQPQQIGELIRYQNLGKTVHKLIHKFPRIEILAYAQPITRSCLRIDLQLTPDFQWDEKMHGRSEPFHIFILDCDCERILYSEQFALKYKRVVQSDSKNYSFSFTVPLFEIMHPIYFIKVVSDRWMQCESEQAIPFKNLILPEPFSRVTELLGRSPLPIEAIQYPNIETALKKKVLPLGTTHFDSVQTQVFANVYDSDESVLIGCPSFQSKHILPYLAVLASVQLHSGEKSVFVAPSQRTCETKFRDFVSLFSKSGVLHLKVGMLTGQINKDSKTLEHSDIIVSTARDWDIMSRRWRSRKGFQNIRLFVADDLHLLGENGSVLEVVVSRMRMISAQTKPIRIVGLCLSVADYRELGEWIGATPANTISFSPAARLNKVQILTFDQSHRPTRLNAMLKQVYPALRVHNKELSVLYVSDRKLARLCALDLMTMATADSITFLNSEDGDIKQIIEQVRGDQYLQYTLASGIGYLYESMDARDQEILLNLIKVGAVNAVVVTQVLALQLNLKAKTVVVLDNYKYDGLEKHYVDYSISEMLEMIESAHYEREARCFVLVHSPKAEYFRKFLFEPLPVESHLNHFLANHLNAEIVAKNVNTTQDSIDWLTWSFMYRRLLNNPNYYNLSEISGQGVNNYLSQLIEDTIEELQVARCIAVEEDQDLDAINSGIIANYYYINVKTVAQFCELISDKSKLRDLLFCLSQAQEFEVMQIRNSEETVLAKIARSIHFTPMEAKLNEPNTKVFILLQAYFHRMPLNSDLRFDLNEILELAVRLGSAMVDVASSNLWLRPAIQCMQLCQMLIQAMWVNTDSLLKQLPYFDDSLIAALKEREVEDIAGLMDMQEHDREKALAHLDQSQIELIAKTCNRYPSVEIKNVASEETIAQNEVVNVTVLLERLGEDYTDFVIAPHYTKPKEEQWWVLCADRKSNRLFGNKKVSLRDFAKVDLRFQAPEPGDYELTIYAICDSYIGADQIKTFQLRVTPPVEEAAIEEEEEA